MKVNYSRLCDLIEEGGEEAEEEKGREKGRFLLIQSNKIVEQVASAAFVGPLAGIY